MAAIQQAERAPNGTGGTDFCTIVRKWLDALVGNSPTSGLFSKSEGMLSSVCSVIVDSLFHLPCRSLGMLGEG